MCKIVEEYRKNAKNVVLDLAPPRPNIPEFFTITPVLTSTLTVCRRNRGDPSSLLYIRFRVRYKYYKNSRFYRRDVVSGVFAVAKWLAGCLCACLSQPVLYQND